MIDGAGPVRTFFSVTLPQLKPTMVLTVVMVTTWAFQMFVQPYMMTQGGPDYATSTITFYLYKQAFNSYNIGYGSCIAVVGVGNILNNHTIREISDEESVMVMNNKSIRTRAIFVKVLKYTYLTLPFSNRSISFLYPYQGVISPQSGYPTVSSATPTKILLWE